MPGGRQGRRRVRCVRAGQHGSVRKGQLHHDVRQLLLPQQPASPLGRYYHTQQAQPQPNEREREGVETKREGGREGEREKERARERARARKKREERGENRRRVVALVDVCTHAYSRESVPCVSFQAWYEFVGDLACLLEGSWYSTNEAGKHKRHAPLLRTGSLRDLFVGSFCELRSVSSVISFTTRTVKNAQEPQCPPCV